MTFTSFDWHNLLTFIHERFFCPVTLLSGAIDKGYPKAPSRDHLLFFFLTLAFYVLLSV